MVPLVNQFGRNKPETSGKQAENKGQTTGKEGIKMNRMNGDAGALLNGRAKRVKAKPARRGSRKAMKYARGLAVGVGSVGVGVLGLSVVHCTESIELLTGSHWALAGLLAVGIDAGMVASELAEVASHGTRSQLKVRRWPRCSCPCYSTPMRSACTRRTAWYGPRGCSARSFRALSMPWAA
jgi:hypothetical protein